MHHWLRAGHILSRIYNCAKHGNRPIDSAKTAHFTLQIRFYNCTNCDQLHVKICPGLGGMEASVFKCAAQFSL